MRTNFSAERVIDAPADVVYRCLADYTHRHRPGAFLPPAFSNQEVLSGGVGDGTGDHYWGHYPQTTPLYGELADRGLLDPGYPPLIP